MLSWKTYRRNNILSKAVSTAQIWEPHMAINSKKLELLNTLRESFSNLKYFEEITTFLLLIIFFFPSIKMSELQWGPFQDTQPIKSLAFINARRLNDTIQRHNPCLVDKDLFTT